jgi:integrase
MRAPSLNGKTYRHRVPRSDGRTVRISCDTRDRATALAIGRMVEGLADRGEAALLDAICDRREGYGLMALWNQYREDPTLGDAKIALTDVDLSPLTTTWHASLVERDKAGAADYLRQVRRFIPENQSFPRSKFNRVEIAGFLDGLTHSDSDDPVTNSTRNRYRSALRQFGKWLVRKGVIEHNPVGDVDGESENPERVVWYDPEQLQELIDRLDSPFKAYEAIMAGTGMESCAVHRLHRRHIDLDARTIQAWGASKKHPHRNRICHITEAWTLPLIAEYVRDMLPSARLFAFNERTAWDHHIAAEEGDPEHGVAKLTPHAPEGQHYEHTTLHDHRHCYAVNSRKRGMPDALIAHQLGHANTLLIAKRYGRFVPNAKDFAPWVAAASSPASIGRRKASRLS